MQFFFFHSLVALRRSHFQCGKCEGRRSQSSEARTPSLALPPRWARKEFFVVVCAALLTFVCMLRYSEWNAVPTSFLDSSVLIGIFCTNLAFQDRTPSPLPSPVLFFSCRLEASARGRWHRAGLLRRRGDYYLGCGRRRYCGRVCCLSRRRVLALPQCF